MGDNLTLFNNGVDEIGAETVAEVAVVGGGKHDDIGLFAGGEGADLVATADGVGGVEGGGDEGLGGGEAHVAASEGDDHLLGFAPASAGIAIGGEGEGAAGVENFLGGGVFVVAEAEGGAGEADGDGFTEAEGDNIFIGGFDEVVGGGGAEGSGEGGAAETFKLIGMEFELIAEVAAPF